jgi:hypothetical protein
MCLTTVLVEGSDITQDIRETVGVREGVGKGKRLSTFLEGLLRIAEPP